MSFLTHASNANQLAYEDNCMHYERHGQTLALTLILYLPALVLMTGWLVVSMLRSRYHTVMR